MMRQRWDPKARRRPKARWSALVTGLLLAATAVPLAAAAWAGTARKPAAAWRRSATCAPFDYIPEADRQRGGLTPETPARFDDKPKKPSD